MSNDNDADKTFSMHNLADTALTVVDKFCFDTDCTSYQDHGGCAACKIHTFKQFCDSLMFKNKKPILELDADEIPDADDCRYPSEYFLACLGDLQIEPVTTFYNPETFWHWLSIIEYQWHWREETWILDEENKRLELHTGGWSGNEDIIDALHHTMFWALCFDHSCRGGHYYFDLSNLSFMKDNEEVEE